MRYCIGCRNLQYNARDPGHMGSTWTGVYGEEEARAACLRGHWMLEFGPDSTLEDFQRAMEKAETCSSYVERMPEHE